MTYEGSTNYETYVVSLWIANDPGEYAYWTKIARDVESADELAGYLKSAFEYHMPESDGVWGDLLQAGLDEVDWLDVAEGIIEK